MQLASLSVRPLHGHITESVQFNPDLNLLVGINGSGKTSLLNIIDLLLRFDLKRLSTTAFEEA